MMIVLWGCLLATGADTKITVLSDIHVMAPELIVNDGKAWQDFLAAKRTMLDYSTQLFDEQVERLVAERLDIVLITGDLTKDGETASHRLVVSQLDRLRTAGIKVLVIPGDHDLGMPSALIYDGDKTSKAETTPSGITSVEADSEQGTYYNLQGIRVTAPSTKGLYIQNGRLKPVR